MYLVDTNIISARAPTKVARADLDQWMDQVSDRLFLSAITVAEIHDGIAKLYREGATKKAGQLAEWWSTVEHIYGDRILPFDINVAHQAGMLLDRARGNGHTPGWADVAIAATARTHTLIILTDNEKDFQPLGVPYANPLKERPSALGSLLGRILGD